MRKLHQYLQHSTDSTLSNSFPELQGGKAAGRKSPYPRLRAETVPRLQVAVNLVRKGAKFWRSRRVTPNWNRGTHLDSVRAGRRSSQFGFSAGGAEVFPISFICVNHYYLIISFSFNEIRQLFLNSIYYRYVERFPLYFCIIYLSLLMYILAKNWYCQLLILILINYINSNRYKFIRLSLNLLLYIVTYICAKQSIF